MARGWDLGNRFGTQRIMCANPPGPGGLVEPGPEAIVGPGDFIPNVFTGLGPNDASLPTINMGAANFSLEAWWCFRYTGDPAPYDNRMMIGYTDVALPGFFLLSSGIEFFQNTLNYRVWYDAVTGGAARVGTGFLGANTGWNYIAVNFTRATNMTVYLNGILVATVAIDNVNTGVHSFLPGVCPTDDWANIYPLNSDPAVAVGPVAHHAGLLTAAQIQDSFRGRRVQMLGTTQIYYDWRRVRGHTGWDFTTGPDDDHNQLVPVSSISPFCYIRGLLVGAPTGVAGTVVVPDLSGNGNDWTLTTQATYGPALRPAPADYTAQATVGFMADPWWAN